MTVNPGSSVPTVGTKLRLSGCIILLETKLFDIYKVSMTVTTETFNDSP